MTADRVARLILAVGLAVLTLTWALLLLYGFGAGYFSPVAVPTPWNVIVTGLLLLGLIWLLARIVRAAVTNDGGS